MQFIPALGIFGGQAQSSRDTTGFDWVSGTTTGHTPRYSYSEGATFGGSAGLTVEVPIYRWFAARASVAEWVFSGAPLFGDRTRTTLGAGLAVWVETLMRAPTENRAPIARRLRSLCLAAAALLVGSSCDENLPERPGYLRCFDKDPRGPRHYRRR